MKTKNILLGTLFVCTFATLFTACGGGDSDKKDGKDVKVKPIETPVKNSGELCLAYVLLDTLQSQYKFFQDIEAEIRTKTEAAEAQLKQAQQRVTNKEQEMENKYKSGQYTSQDQYEADMRAGQQLLQQAQQLEARLQGELATFMNEKQQAVNDTIQKVMNEFAEAKGYDFIFSKTSSIDHLLYANPTFDVTEEVVTLLNRLYAPEAGSDEKKK